jgi:hypothetical protein
MRTSCLGVLPTYAEAPVVSETTVRPDLLQALKVIAHLRVDAVGQDLRVLSVNDILLPVQEPCRDLELSRVLHDRDDALKFVRVKVSGAGNEFE